MARSFLDFIKRVFGQTSVSLDQNDCYYWDPEMESPAKEFLQTIKEFKTKQNENNAEKAKGF